MISPSCVPRGMRDWLRRYDDALFYIVTPAKAEVQGNGTALILDSRLRGNDGGRCSYPVDADACRKEAVALYARAALRPCCRYRALSRIPALVRRRPHPRAQR